MPGAVKAITIDPSIEMVLAGNSLGLVLAFDFSGESVGRLALSAEVQSISGWAKVMWWGLPTGRPTG